MSRSNDPGHYFQTTSSLEASERRAVKSKNRRGNPVILQSKVLAVISDTRSGNEGSVFVAESAGTARWIDLKKGGTAVDSSGAQVDTQQSPHRVYRGATAPLTSLAISTEQTTLFAGCWDKCVWSWDINSTKGKRKYIGHSDFVKSVICAPNTSLKTEPTTDILISGSADASIIIWRVETGEKIHTIRGADRARGILDLTIDPSTISHDQATSKFTLYAGCSDPAIHRWEIEILTPADRTIERTRPDITVNQQADVEIHDTSVNMLRFTQIPDDGDNDDDQTTSIKTPYALFTASSDKSAKQSIQLPIPSSGNIRTSGAEQDAAVAEITYKTKATLAHPDFVRAVLVSPAHNSIVTGCRDGDVRVFDLDEEGANIEPVHVFRGHFEEVAGLTLVSLPQTNGKSELCLVSVSIDGTVRRWGGLAKQDLAKAAALEEIEEADEANQPSGLAGQGKAIELTAEEEAELAELMEEESD